MAARRWSFLVAATLAALVGAATGARAESPLVVNVALDAEINDVTAGYVAQAVTQAESEHAAAIVLSLNTPGGLSTSMDSMVQSLLGSSVPVIVYVEPSGARADSAGLFVAQAADVLAMAPGTNIGSAHPIDASGGNLTGDLGTKVLNDAVARIRQLATMHGRNADWCEQAVRQSVNIGADQAVAIHVADLQATSVSTLLAAVDGRSLRGGALTLHTAGARVEAVGLSPIQQFLLLLADPNVAFLLLLVAVFGLIGEFTTPGAVLPGTVGVIAAILALVGFSSLPVNLAGILLVLFAFVLFVIDLKAPSHGVLTAGGVLSLVLGGALLINTGPQGAGFGVSYWVLAIAALACAGFFGFVIGKAMAARHRPAYDLSVTPVERGAEREQGEDRR